MARFGGAAYLQSGFNPFGQQMANLMLQRSVMDAGTEFLCEADSYPQTLFSMSAKSVRGFIAGSILAGKVETPYTWIPNTSEWVREEWGAYADVLGGSARFFAQLKELSRRTEWHGPSSICRRVHHEAPGQGAVEARFDTAWAGQICGRLGIPFTVNAANAAVAMLNGTAAEDLTDDEIRGLLGRGLMLDGGAALELGRRGFSAEIGVDVEQPRQSLEVSLEILTAEEINLGSAGRHLASTVGAPSLIMRLTPHAGTRALGWLVRNRWYQDAEFQRVVPSATVFENRLGGRVAVFAHRVSETASMMYLNQIRRAQLRGVLAWLGRADALVAAATPADTFLLHGRAARPAEDVLAIINLNPDTVEASVDLHWRGRAPSRALRLGDDGVWRALPFAVEGGRLKLKTPLEMMRPLVARLAD
jgi:hypothetical protein